MERTRDRWMDPVAEAYEPGIDRTVLRRNYGERDEP